MSFLPGLKARKAGIGLYKGWVQTDNLEEMLSGLEYKKVGNLGDGNRTPRWMNPVNRV
jgi:hypothetical protein